MPTNVIVEVEEIIALKEYKNIKLRVCLEDEAGDDVDEVIGRLGDQARRGIRSQARKALKTIHPDNLAGGKARQWAYVNGRGKRGKKETKSR